MTIQWKAAILYYSVLFGFSILPSLLFWKFISFGLGTARSERNTDTLNKISKIYGVTVGLKITLSHSG